MKPLSLFIIALIIGTISYAQDFKTRQRLELKKSTLQNTTFPRNIWDYNIRENQGLSGTITKSAEMLRDSLQAYNWDELANNWLTSIERHGFFSYDGRLNLNGEMYDRWNAILNEFVNEDQYFYLYDNNDNLTDWIYNKWNVVSGSWEPVEYDSVIYINNIISRESYSYFNKLTKEWFTEAYFDYNTAGALVDYLYWTIDATNFAILGGTRANLTLNPENRPTEEIVQEYDTLSKSWRNTFRTVLDYENDTLLTKETGYMWDTVSQTWSVYGQNLYTYENFLLNEMLYQGWDGVGWYNVQLTSYEYNDALMRSRVLNRYWDGSNWVNMSQILYTYNENNIRTQSLSQSFVNSSWVNLYLNKTIYNSNDLIVERITQRWDINTNLVISRYHYFYFYNGSNLNTETIYQSWSTTTNDWANVQKSLSFYSAHSASVNNLDPEMRIKAYPNPVGSTLYFENIQPRSKAFIYDLKGRLLMVSPVMQNQMDVTCLAPGKYWIRIEGRNMNSTITFIRQ